MKELQEINDPETVKAISDKIRWEILHILQGREKASSTEIARELGLSPSNTSYHLKVLEKHEVIYLNETVVKGNLIEKLYSAVARSISINLSREGSEPEVKGGVVEQTMEFITKDVVHALAEERAGKSTLSYDDYYMSEQEFYSLRDDLLEKVAEYGKRGPGEGYKKFKLGFILVNGGEDDEQKE